MAEGEVWAVTGSRALPPAGRAPHARLDGRSVAIVNWRDPWHPLAGGAEVYAWEISRQLVARGARVSYVTARAAGQEPRARQDGIEVRRMGGRWTVYPRVLLWFLVRRRRFDAVIDCQNGIPFFLPWVLARRVAVVCVVHHVHDAQFGVHFPGWLARVGRFLEGPVARRTYRRHVVAAVSPSTVSALRNRLGWQGRVVIVPNGSGPGPGQPREAGQLPVAGGDSAPPASPAGTGAPTVVCLGRLVAHKRVAEVVTLADTLAVTWPELTVHIVGRGPEAGRLAELVDRRGLAGRVRLHGYLPEADKRALLAAAWLHVTASQGEGWGQSVLEAAGLGTPTVAYDVEGIRDAIRDGETGWLVRPGGSLAEGVDRALRALTEPEVRASFAASCRSWAGRFTWDRAGELMAVLVRAELDGGAGPPAAPRSAALLRPAGPRRGQPGPGQPAGGAGPPDRARMVRAMGAAGGLRRGWRR